MQAKFQLGNTEMHGLQVSQNENLSKCSGNELGCCVPKLFGVKYYNHFMQKRTFICVPDLISLVCALFK